MVRKLSEFLWTGCTIGEGPDSTAQEPHDGADPL
jgi:hypothetical protein